ncbi:hypothetical protein NL64_26955 [Pseudomonas fluorescens]|uniref:hypothetical protein n=1 Tax=Pseudomonas fluorescens TaxID=294 RepID=UPI00054BB03E|nr:hypothetical protein [Pseudomonas fluorescens]KII27581.1 hypothetical protein NL64_26955 [Pseudomonas fluorescens]
MNKLIVACSLFLSVLSSLAFAEDGADRLHEKNEIHVQEAQAAKQKAKNETQNTAKSCVEANSKNS